MERSATAGELVHLLEQVGVMPAEVGAALGLAVLPSTAAVPRLRLALLQALADRLDAGDADVIQERLILAAGDLERRTAALVLRFLPPSGAVLEEAERELGL